MPGWIIGFAFMVAGIGVLALIDMLMSEEVQAPVPQQQVKEVFDMSSLKHVEQQDELTSTLFDCPECNMPAEVATYVTMWEPESQHAMTYVVINCLSDHDLITVTQEWFVDHVLSQSQE